MVQESQDNPNLELPEVVAENDNVILDSEVWAEVLDISEKVDHIRIWWLKEFLWLYSTKIWALRIASLDKARAANDNNTESKKAA